MKDHEKFKPHFWSQVYKKQVVRDRPIIDNTVEKIDSSIIKSKHKVGKVLGFIASLVAGVVIQFTWTSAVSYNENRVGNDVINDLKQKYEKVEYGFNDFPPLLEKLKGKPQFNSEYNFYLGYYLLKSIHYRTKNELSPEYYFGLISPTSSYYGIAQLERFHHSLDMLETEKVSGNQHRTKIRQIIDSYEIVNSYDHLYFYLRLMTAVNNHEDNVSQIHDIYMQYVQELKSSIESSSAKSPTILLSNENPTSLNYAYERMLQDQAIHYLCMLLILRNNSNDGIEMKIQNDLLPYLKFANAAEMNNYIQVIEAGLSYYKNGIDGQTILNNFHFLEQKFGIVPSFKLTDYKPSSEFTNKITVYVPVEEEDKFMEWF